MHRRLLRRRRCAGGGGLAERNDVSSLVTNLLEGIAGRMEDVADEAGVSYSALYSWATGRRRPGRANLNKLATLAEERSVRLQELADDLTRLSNSGNGGQGDAR